jgi:hypothetical protein
MATLTYPDALTLLGNLGITVTGPGTPSGVPVHSATYDKERLVRRSFTFNRLLQLVGARAYRFVNPDRGNQPGKASMATVRQAIALVAQVKEGG